mgnify:CR=1 FL=1
MIDLALRLDSYRSHIAPYGRRAWPDYERRDDFGVWVKQAFEGRGGAGVMGLEYWPD